MPRRSRRWRRSVARSRRFSTSTSCFPRIAQLDQARDRLPHVRHLAGQRGTRRARDEARGAVRGEGRGAARPRSARGSSDTRRCIASRYWSPTCRRIRATSSSSPDVRSELVIPMLLKDRCIGVVDLESPELDAFSKRDVEILTLLASQAAVAIENARLYEEVRSQRGTSREGAAIRAARANRAAAQRVRPSGSRGSRSRAAFASAREVGGDFHDYLSPEANTLVVARRRRVGQGRAGGAVQRVCRRTGTRPHLPPALSAGPVESGGGAVVGEHHPSAASARGVLLHALLRGFRPQTPCPDACELGLPYPIRCTADGCAQIELPGVPLGSFQGSTYDELTFALHAGDLFVLCTDGVFEAMNEDGQEFTAARLLDVVAGLRDQPAAKVAEAIFGAVHAWRGDAPPNDDMTAVAVRITA